MEVGSEEAVETALGETLSLVSDGPRSRRMVLLDTFDWRLWADGGELLLSDGRALSWRDLQGNERCQLEVEGVPAFARDLAPGPFRMALEAVVAMRRLLPVAELAVTERPWRILDANEKTVVRARIESRRARVSAGDALVHVPLLVLRSVRGYDAAFGEAVALVEGALQVERERRSELELALAGSSRRPGDYSGKLRVRLEAGMRADAAMRLVHLDLLEIVTANEAGVRADLDSEFLHDFRVALRRTRSGLTQVKGVYPPEVVAHFREELRWLFGHTGPTRDLDVYLLKIPSYRARLPEHVGAHLDPLEDFLRRRQRAAQAKLVTVLDDRRAQLILASWREFLESPLPEEAVAPCAHRPAGEVARDRIGRAWRRVLKRGRAIGPDTPADALHQLRIEAKKLRYLLEFFRSLFPSELVAVIKALKLLQDNLGDFNDYEVQQEQLQRFARSMVKEGKVPAETLLALGRLVGRLEEGQQEERQRFESRFGALATKKNERRFDRLLATVGGEG